MHFHIFAGYQARLDKRVVTIEMSTGDKGQDYAEVAKREKLQPLELELKKIEDTVGNIKAEFNYMRQREARHRDTNGISLGI